MPRKPVTWPRNASSANTYLFSVRQKTRTIQIVALNAVIVPLKTGKKIGLRIRVKTPLSLEEAQRCVADFVKQYNTERLHSAIGYITPLDKLEGRAEAIQAQRERKLLADARQARKALRKVS